MQLKLSRNCGWIFKGIILESEKFKIVYWAMMIIEQIDHGRISNTEASPWILTLPKLSSQCYGQAAWAIWAAMKKYSLKLTFRKCSDADHYGDCWCLILSPWTTPTVLQPCVHPSIPLRHSHATLRATKGHESFVHRRKKENRDSGEMIQLFAQSLSGPI